MLAHRLIERKRDGGRIEAGEWRALALAYAKGYVPDYQMAALLMACYLRGLDRSETAALTEAILTLGLVSVILGTAAGARNVGFNGAIAVGAYIGLVSVWGAPVSGASMNPGRSLAPMLVGGNLDHYWVYLVGPIVGALVAVAFEFILRGRATKGGAEAAQGILDEDSTGI